MYRLLFTLCIGLSALAAPAQRVRLPEGYTAHPNVVYTRVGPWEGKMDLYLPPACGMCRLAPVVVHMHGGGFTHGSRESQGGFEVFFEMGFAVANISYRLAKIAPAPAAVEDARCAVAYLAQHAAALHVDRTKIVTRGSSAGGHLALMAGLLSRSDAFAERCPGVHAGVAAVVDICAPTDLTTWSATAGKANKATRGWLGRGEHDTSFMRSLSPVAYVSADAPPVFVAHGTADKTVPIAQSQQLVDALRAGGAYVDFFVVENGGHELTAAERSAVNMAMVKFLKQVLELP